MRGRAVLCIIAASVAPGLLGQTTTLNPTVKVLPKAVSMVPTECEYGLAPAPPRPVLEAAVETPQSSPAPPPTSDLRTTLRRVQAAAESGNYDAFKAALGEARTALASYPRGGERDSVLDAMRVYGDLEQLWDYAMTSPTGAFFDASSEGGAIVKMLGKYPTFPKAVEEATLTVGGQTIYPSRETRAILVNDAASRLARLGVRTPNRVVQEHPRVVTPQPQPRVPPRPSTATTRKPPATRSTTATAHRPSKPHVVAPGPPSSKPRVHHPTRIAVAQPKPHLATPQPRVQPQPVAPKPATPQPVAPRVAAAPSPAPSTEAPGTSLPMPQPIVSIPSTTTEAAPTTMTTASTPPPTETSATAATETAPAQKPAPAAGGGMNLTFAIVLIVVGIGVLIVLFRASD